MTKLPFRVQNAVLLTRSFCRKVPTNGSSVCRNTFMEPFDIVKRFLSAVTGKNIVHSPLGDMKIPNILFHECIFKHLSHWDKRTAVMCARSGKKYTFRELQDFSKALAAGLQNKFNLKKGDILAMTLFNCPEMPLIFLAASQIGITVTPVNPNYTNFEMQNHLEVAQPKVTITTTGLYQKCQVVADALKLPPPVIVLKSEPSDSIPAGTIDLYDMFDPGVSGQLSPVDISTDDTLILPFSSGTTGKPKGVILTHKNLVSNMTQLGHPETTLLISPTFLTQSSVLGILPMYHIYGMVVVTFVTLKEGSRLIVLPSFVPGEFVSSLHQYKINVLFAVPPLVSLLAHDSVAPKFLKHLSYIVNGSARYNLKDVEKILSKAEHVKVAQGYGMTEASPVLTHTPTSRMQKIASVGVPIASTSLKVVNTETGEPLPSGKTGEICAMGPQMMKGYYKRPKETQESFDKDGWLRTGDLGYYDDDGDFYVVDRLKEMIKVSGLQVSPTEVEETLKILPKIKEVVVVGVPDEKFGEVPKAFIVLHKKGDLTESEVNSFLAEKLSPHKQLRGGIVFVDELPKSSTGKVLRGELKKRP